MNLQKILVTARLYLKDLGLKIAEEPLLILAANEGKDELAKIIRQARQDYFLTSTTGTVLRTTPPNPSMIDLPADFAELKEIRLTDVGFERVGFVQLDRSDPRFKAALVTMAPTQVSQGGQFSYFYDIVANATMLFAPAFDANRAYQIDYIQTVPDMALPTDEPTLIPKDHHSWITNYVVCEGLRANGDKRLPLWEAKLGRMTQNVVNSVGARQVREPEFVMGFMEAEEW